MLVLKIIWSNSACGALGVPQAVYDLVRGTEGHASAVKDMTENFIYIFSSEMLVRYLFGTTLLRKATNPSSPGNWIIRKAHRTWLNKLWPSLNSNMQYLCNWYRFFFFQKDMSLADSMVQSPRIVHTVKEFLFWRLIAVFIGDWKWSLSWDRLILSTPSHPTPFSSHLHLSPPSDFF
jgi:hypothetical protein